jgi:hypothetical protein
VVISKRVEMSKASKEEFFGNEVMEGVVSPT